MMKKHTKLLLCFFAVLLATFVFFAIPMDAEAAELPAAPAQTPFDRATDTCPCCGVEAKNIDWKELSTASTSTVNPAAGHYVVTSAKNLGSYYNINGNKKVVIVFENTVTGVDGNIALRAGIGGATGDDVRVWLLGGPNGKITGTGSATTNFNGGLMRFGPTATVVIGGALTVERSGSTAGYGGLFDVYSSNVTMTGGTLNGITSTGTGNSAGAVIVRSGGSFTMTGGIINGGSTKNGGAVYITTEGSGSSVTIGGNAYINSFGKTVTGNGAAVYMDEGSLTVNGGTIIGGNAAKGGAIYIASGEAELSAGTIYGGSTTEGGAVYIASGDLEITGATVTGGTSTSYGGNIYMTTNCSVTISDGTVSGGTGSWGGNIYAYAGDFEMTGGTVSGGKGSRGGNMYIGGNFAMSGGTVSGGTATQYAGNIFMASGASKTCTITGGSILNGTSNGSYLGGNLHIYAVNVSISDTAAPVIISGGSAYQGGNISISQSTAGITLNLTRATSIIENGTATEGGNIFAKGTSTLTSGTISGGSATNGGNICVAGGSVTLAGATVTGGSGSDGGSMYVAEDATLTMNSGEIKLGSAANGGCIYNLGTVTMNGGTVSDGTATTNGGNLYSKGDVTLTAGTLSGGKATSNGGNIFQSTGTIELNGATVTGGSAANGGCLYVLGGATFTMTAGEMKLGTASSQGAIGFIKGTFEMTGGTVTANAKATCNARGLRIHDGVADLSGNANIISCAKSTGDGLNVVSVSKTATVILDGNAQVWSTDDNIYNNIVFHNYHDGEKYVPTMLTVKPGWTGKTSVRFGHITDGLDTFAPGGSISATYASSQGAYTGQLYLENETSLPRIYGKGTLLVYSGVELQTLTGYAKHSQWFETNAQAVTAYAATENENKLLKLYTDDALDLSGNEVYVDFNGKTVAVTLSGGKLYGFDSTATTANAGKAAVTIADGQAELYAENAVNGKRTIALTGETTTFHTVAVDITTANVRPGVAGIYYGARIACDDTLKPYVSRYGVAVSLVHLPGEDFTEDPKTIFVDHKLDKLGQESYNGVLVEKIMKNSLAADANKNRAEAPIYANAYMYLTIEEQPLLLMAQTTSQMSMKDATQRINGMWPALTESNQKLFLEKIYDAYISNFSVNDWNLFNIEAAKAGTPVTEELKILTIGNSLSVDATRMLAYIAQQEGSQGVKIGTLYHANCSLQEHADFLTNDKAEYWYYESGFDAQNPGTLTEGSLVPKETRSYIGKDAIVAEDWDIIIMQHSVFQSGDPETYDASIETIIRYVNAHKTNPNAVFAWNMTWMGPVDTDLLATANTSSPGFDKTYKEYTKDTLDREAQTMMYERIVSAVQSKVANSGRFVYLLPSATMMQNALNATSDKVMYRDYIHGSDYGRLMNGYLWYSILTGKEIAEPAVTQIPGQLRFAEADRTSDLALTQRQQNILVEAVNNAIESPFEATESQYAKDGQLSVLAIGNSFAQDTTYYLDDIARAQGYTDVKIAYLYIGGCTLKTHAAKMNGNLADYEYYENFNGAWVKKTNYTMETAISSRQWDVVTLQQGSPNSGQSSTYEPYLGQLVEYIQEKQPDAKILWHMTWAYQGDSTHSGFANYDKDQMTMYNAIVDAYNTAVKPYLESGDMDGVLACGTAVQNARTSYVGDNLTRDGYHLNPLGRYMTACLWYSALTGETLTELDLTKVDSKLTLTDRDKAMVIEAVNNALTTPCAVTQATDK